MIKYKLHIRNPFPPTKNTDVEFSIQNLTPRGVDWQIILLRRGVGTKEIIG